MDINTAEAILDEYRTRENAILADDVESWDEAYKVALDAHSKSWVDAVDNLKRG